MLHQKNIEKLSDEELVDLTLQDQECLLFIVNRYKDKLYKYVRRISNVPEEEIEDVLQVVFLKVYQNLNDFDTGLKFSSWIYRITRNEVISGFRKKQARPQKALAVSNDGTDEDLTKNLATEFNIERDVDLKFLRGNIYKVLDKMKEQHKEIIILKFFEEKDYKEISDIIKKPMGTVASLMNRAKREFKNCYVEDKK